MTTTSSSSPHNDLIANARFLHAYLECSDEIQAGVRDMLKIVFDLETDDADRAMAMHTIADALYPNPQNGILGMDLEESEQDTYQGVPEMRDIVDQMNEEESLFADRLRSAMESKGWTQCDLARLTGVGQSAISNMLIRQCRPQRRTILKLSEALQLSPEALWPGFSE